MTMTAERPMQTVPIDLRNWDHVEDVHRMLYAHAPDLAARLMTPAEGCSQRIADWLRRHGYEVVDNLETGDWDL